MDIGISWSLSCLFYITCLSFVLFFIFFFFGSGFIFVVVGNNQCWDRLKEWGKCSIQTRLGLSINPSHDTHYYWHIHWMEKATRQEGKHESHSADKGGGGGNWTVMYI